MPGRRVSERQLELLVKFAETHPNFVMGRNGGPLACVAAKQAWEAVAHKLNAICGGGIRKTAPEWRRYWIEYKAKTKSKAADIRRRGNNIGDRSSRLVPLTGLEFRVMSFIDRVAAENLRGIQAPPPQPPVVVEVLQESDIQESDVEVIQSETTPSANMPKSEALPCEDMPRSETPTSEDVPQSETPIEEVMLPFEGEEVVEELLINNRQESTTHRQGQGRRQTGSAPGRPAPSAETSTLRALLATNTRVATALEELVQIFRDIKNLL
ncbi:uncharacterized protein LOC112046522 isoform X2 [Bicyclus anynana]|uniref:Regulatory protein zeste n=1 Tax=Bicyclus anynana TaxID=110368 RepID=A0A6J1N1P0_BICAN|nr:uncharacterized protein LOC112046522 isoform X2 [Bicyclus anynana]